MYSVEPAIECANNAQLCSNEQIISRRLQEAVDVYSEVVEMVTELKSDANLAWSLVLALSKHTKAFWRGWIGANQSWMAVLVRGCCWKFTKECFLWIEPMLLVKSLFSMRRQLD